MIGGTGLPCLCSNTCSDEQKYCLENYLLNSTKYINLKGRFLALNIFHLIVIFFVLVPRLKAKTYCMWSPLWKAFCGVFEMLISFFALCIISCFCSLNRFLGKISVLSIPNYQKKKFTGHYSAILIIEVLNFWEKLSFFRFLLAHFFKRATNIFCLVSSKWRIFALDMSAVLKWINFDQWGESLEILLSF